MFEILERFDIWIIEERFEKFAHWWQKLTGKDCFWLARVASFVPPFFFICPIISKCINTAEKNALSAQEKGFSNPLKLSDRQGRIFFFCSVYPITLLLIIAVAMVWLDSSEIYILIFASIATAVLVGMLGSSTAILYFVACDPLPPGREKSKIKQWVDSMRQKLVPTPALVQVPSS